MRTVSIILSIICLTIPIHGVKAFDLGAEGSLGAFSSYIWRGFKLSEDAVQLQPSATLSAGGFSANLWAEYDTDTDEWLELDTTVSYTHDIDTLSLELGYIHYDINDGIDSDEIYLSASFGCLLEPSLAVYVDVNEGSGAFVVGGIGHSMEFSEWSTFSLAASASFILDNGYMATDASGEEFSGFFNGDLTASVSISLGEYVSVEPMAGYTVALSDDASDAIKSASFDDDDNFLYAGVTVTVSI